MSRQRAAILCQLLTPERLSSYFASARGDVDDALALYERNLSAAAAIVQTTAMVEVIVRNSMDRQLTQWARIRNKNDWLTEIDLDKRGQSDLRRASVRARDRRDSHASHGKTVAELNFGFWRFLAARRYYTYLWVPALHEAFPFGPAQFRTRQESVERALGRLSQLRNRAAHHEPVHERDLIADLELASETASWIHPIAGAWITSTSMIHAVNKARPFLTRIPPNG